jgi:plasmid stabilization system protein ParE
MAEVKWSENVSFYYAQEQAKAFFARAGQLEKHPLSGRPVPELNSQTIRQVLCGSYRIIYEVKSEEYLIILTIHHQSRLPGSNPVF